MQAKIGGAKISCNTDKMVLCHRRNLLHNTLLLYSHRGNRYGDARCTSALWYARESIPRDSRYASVSPVIV